MKVGFLAFMLAGVYAVLRPNDTTVVAHWLGVDRGADLMLYALIVAFSFSTLNTWTSGHPGSEGGLGISHEFL